MNPLGTAFRQILVVAIALGTVGAQTFVVDANNGAGTDFTSLAAATASAPDGALLLVRPGMYDGPVSIQGKSLTVLCEAGATVHSQFGLTYSVAIDGIAAHQVVSLRGLQMFAPSFHTQTGLRCTNSPGLICIEGVTPSPANNGANNLFVTACAAVWLHGCGFVGRTDMASSEVAMVSCQIPAAGNFQLNGIQQVGGVLQLADCTVRGLASMPTGGPAVEMVGGTLRLLGNTTITGGLSFLTPTGRAIEGLGDVAMDTSVVLTGGAPLIGPTISAVTQHMPHVTVAEVPPLGTVEARLHGPQGDAGLLLVSLPGPVFALPFLTDTVWLDPGSMLVLVAGVPAAGAPVTGTIFMPNVSTTLGFKVVWQGLTASASTGWQISNPEYFVVH